MKNLQFRYLLCLGLLLLLLSCNVEVGENEDIEYATIQFNVEENRSRQEQGSFAVSAGDVKTAIILSVPASQSTAETLLGLKSYDRKVLDISSQNVSLLVPLDQPIRLAEFTFAYDYTLGEVLRSRPRSIFTGLSDPFLIMGNEEEFTINIPLAENTGCGSASIVDSDFPHSNSVVASDNSSVVVNTIIPHNGETSVDPASSVIVFLSAPIAPSTISDTTPDATFSIFEGNTQVFGLINGELTQSGDTVISFTPFCSFNENQNITVTLAASGIETMNGHTFAETFQSVFSTGTTNTTIASSGDLGFENGLSGAMNCLGDCAIRSDFGDTTPSEGQYAAYLSSGTAIVSASGDAEQGKTSRLVINNIMESGTYLNFKYDFISEEFDEFVGSQFDDTFLVIISGNGGVISKTVASVNQIGIEDSLPGTFPSLSDAEHTGIKAMTIDISTLLRPFTISFMVSDVGDTSLSSVVLIDQIQFTNTQATTNYMAPQEPKQTYIPLLGRSEFLHMKNNE